MYIGPRGQTHAATCTVAMAAIAEGFAVSCFPDFAEMLSYHFSPVTHGAVHSCTLFPILPCVITPHAWHAASYGIC